MSRITEYQASVTFDQNDVLLKDGENGTRTISVENAASEFKRLSGTDTQIEELYETKANTDGSYETMTVGNANQLVSKQYAVDTDPYLFRTSGGTADIGDREYNEIVGGSLVWNQLIPKNVVWNPISSSFCNVEYDSNGLVTMTVLASGNAIGVKLAYSANRIPKKGHKYFASYDIISDKDTRIRFMGSQASIGNTDTAALKDINANVWSRASFVINIGDANETTTWFFYVNVLSSLEVDDTVRIKNVNVIDLTQMFGTVIADYIYSLEQAEKGAGVAWFRKYFPKDYYEYNAGEFIHVTGLQSHNMVGFNQWDEEWEVGVINGTTGLNANDNNRIRSVNFNPCFPNTEYYKGDANIYWYDADKQFIKYNPTSSGNVVTSPSNAAYFKISAAQNYGPTYHNDICINLSWSGWRDGEYEPYEKHSYPLDSTLTLMGVPRLSADGELYFDGDRYAADGTVTRRAVMVTLDGSEGWQTNSTASENNYYSTRLGEYGSVIAGVCLCDKYSVVSMASTSSAIGVNVGNSSARNRGQVSLRPENVANMTVATFKEWLAENPVTIVYLLSDDYATTEEADSYQSPQIVDDFGTEEFVTGSIVPVGHETKYPVNMRDKLQHLPNLADSDGYYMIHQQSYNMSLIRFGIPQAPTTDGSYILKATVSNGTPTYTWVDENAVEPEEP